jgi:ATP-dependent DNA ligase
MAPTLEAEVASFLRGRGAPNLEGIVTKLASGRYHADGTSTNWCKVKNPAYTQMTARHEFFERRTGSRTFRPMPRLR